ncbi:STAS domain-containing protein [Actinoplanes sp. DH11]|uniref:STAS domain-containing protein n=1 Tax=Actinoplanes sp. DH11 TaxID=2857011 RepID=UPI001E5B41A0|nr:STAS domain-containing protein [Actinoplanes sp. DH11]
MNADYFTIEKPDRDGTTARVRLAGEFDLNSRDVLAEVLRGIVAEGGCTRIVVDLDQVRFLDSEALSALLEGYLAAQSAGITFRLAAANGVVGRVIEVVGLEYLLDPA